MHESRLEELRTEKNLTNRQIAKAINARENHYSEWEHNKIRIPTSRLVDLAKYYKVSIDYILKLTNVKTHIFSNFDIDLNTISNGLKEIRSDNKLTIREFAKEINIPFTTLSNYERGRTLIQVDILYKICKTKNYSADWLLGRTNNKYIEK